MTIDVKLETADDKHVGWAKVLPFLKAPDVLIWGERVFRLAGSFEPGPARSPGDPDAFHLYKEAFSHVVVTPVTADRQP